MLVELTDAQAMTTRKALERYKLRLQEVIAMGWYNDPTAAHNEIAVADAALAALNANAAAQGQGEYVPVTEYKAGHKYGGMYIGKGIVTLWEEDCEITKNLPEGYTFCRRTSTPAAAQADGLEAPDSPGWYAFEGRWHSLPESKTWKYVLEAEIKDGILYVGFGDDYELPSMLVGKWWKLTMPWERQRPSGEQG